MAFFMIKLRYELCHLNDYSYQNGGQWRTIFLNGGRFNDFMKWLG